MHEINQMLREHVEEQGLDIDTLRGRIEEAGYSYSTDHLRRVLRGKRVVTNKMLNAVVDGLEIDDYEEKASLACAFVHHRLELEGFADWDRFPIFRRVQQRREG
jgi:hypothetical protein